MFSVSETTKHSLKTPVVRKTVVEHPKCLWSLGIRLVVHQREKLGTHGRVPEIYDPGLRFPTPPPTPPPM